MRIVRQRRKVLAIPQRRPVITSVNAAVSPQVAQAAVVITGTEFGAQTGQLTYAGVALTPLTWSDTSVTVDWPDIPYLSIWAALAFGINYTLRLTTADGGRAERLVETVKKTTDIYRAITAIASTGIFANDVGVAVGDYFNWRTISGTVTDVDSTGRPRGTSVGARGRYAVWNGSVWTNTAQSIIQIS